MLTAQSEQCGRCARSIACYAYGSLKMKFASQYLKLLQLLTAPAVAQSRQVFEDRKTESAMNVGRCYQLTTRSVQTTRKV